MFGTVDIRWRGLRISLAAFTAATLAGGAAAATAWWHERRIVEGMEAAEARLAEARGRYFALRRGTGDVAPIRPAVPPTGGAGTARGGTAGTLDRGNAKRGGRDPRRPLSARLRAPPSRKRDRSRCGRPTCRSISRFGMKPSCRGSLVRSNERRPACSPCRGAASSERRVRKRGSHSPPTSTRRVGFGGSPSSSPGLGPAGSPPPVETTGTMPEPPGPHRTRALSSRHAIPSAGCSPPRRNAPGSTRPSRPSRPGVRQPQRTRPRSNPRPVPIRRGAKPAGCTSAVSSTAPAVRWSPGSMARESRLALRTRSGRPWPTLDRRPGFALTREAARSWSGPDNVSIPIRVR